MWPYTFLENEPRRRQLPTIDKDLSNDIGTPKTVDSSRPAAVDFGADQCFLG